MKGAVEMKKTKKGGMMAFVCVGLMLMPAAVLLLGDSQAMAADKIKLVLEAGMPKSTEQTWAGTGQPWTEAVTKRTNGEVVFDPHWGGELATMMEQVKAAGTGLVQISAPYTGYFPSQFPVEAILGTLNYPAFTPPDPTRIAITRILFSEIPAFNEAYTKNNIKKIFTISVPNVGILAGVPINSLKDLKGLKIRTFGKFMSQTVKAAGGIPVNLPFNETIDALSKKVLDGTIINFSNARDTKVHEVAKHVVWLGPNNMPAHVIPYSYVMNLAAWNKLPAQIKRVMLEEGKKVEMEYAVKSMNAQVAATKQMEKEGATIHSLSQKDMNEWEKLCGDLGTEAGKELDGKGLPGTQTISLIRKLAKLSQAELMAEYDKAWEKEFAQIK
jgi:TRAP-type C4-dicarboxylate transport system substrate-binding protein